MFSNENVGKSSNQYICIFCNYYTSKKFNYDKHILTSKHLKSMIINENVGIVAKYSTVTYICSNCNKQYKDNSGLWRHSKKCCKGNTSKAQELVEYLMKENAEFKQLIIDQNKQMAQISSTAVLNAGHNTINSNNNKTFNLQVFLNETCKDAINLTDFVNQIQLSVSDLEETGKLGYAEGISKVFIKNLNDIDFTQRPIHCSDSKREILYIKDDNQWNKEDENKSHLSKAIKQVANKNIKQLSEWQKLNPKYKDPESKQNDKYMKLVLNAMSGSTPEEQKSNITKIIKNVTKEVIIEK